jgi:hypothetical protein
MRTHAALRPSSWRTNRHSPAPSKIATNLGNGAAHVATDFRTLLGHAAVFDQASTSCQSTNKFAAPADRAFSHEATARVRRYAAGGALNAQSP